MIYIFSKTKFFLKNNPFFKIPDSSISFLYFIEILILIKIILFFHISFTFPRKRNILTKIHFFLNIQLFFFFCKLYYLIYLFFYFITKYSYFLKTEFSNKNALFSKISDITSIF